MMLKQILIAVGLWLARQGGWEPPRQCTRKHLPNLGTVLMDRVTQLCRAQDTAHGAGYGEAKRHQVYAQLIKEFPDTPKRVLALAIELATTEAP